MGFIIINQVDWYQCEGCDQDLGSLPFDQSSENKEGSSETTTRIYGCPNCLNYYCWSCVRGMSHAVCACGEPLINSEQPFIVRFDDRLPEEVAIHQTKQERISALDAYRQQHSMIEAEYQHYRSIIFWVSHRNKKRKISPLPPNDAVRAVRRGVKALERSWSMIDLIKQCVLPENVDELIKLIEEKPIYLQDLKEHLSLYPVDAEGWADWEVKYRVPKYHEPYLVPKRTSQELADRDRFEVETLRAGIKRLELLQE